MKAILEFDLPEEQTEHEDALNGWRWKIVVANVDNWLRSKVKYDNKPEFTELRKHLHETIAEEGLELP